MKIVNLTASLKLPNFCEIVVLPGNGFIDEQCCVQKDVGNRCAYYQFSPSLDSSLRGALMREGQYLRLTISRQLEVCLENSNSPPQPVTFIVPPVVGKALSFTGRLPVSVVGVSLEEEIQISEVGRDTPAKLRSVLDWGRQENSTQERRQKICRISKLLGDLSVQLGDFDAGHWHYRNAIRFSSSTDPAIWQSATLVGIGASIYLRQIDVLGKHRFFEVCNSEQCSQRLRPSERLSPILSATGTALTRLIKPKLSITLVVSPGWILQLQKNTLSEFRKRHHGLCSARFSLFKVCVRFLIAVNLNLYDLQASSVPRCVIETAYKSADYLVTAKKRTKAARLLGSLQTDVIPQGVLSRHECIIRQIDGKTGVQFTLAKSGTEPKILRILVEP
ncbi:unnamed protein product [Mesocestoides corti]|uniref:Uncharacterized protein n=1 Tax=Mesocestoides corti TaxID=53468 RepID=A0A0R3UPH9_MESCO|nr:unnamed protein product [Mesocestoides corti]